MQAALFKSTAVNVDTDTVREALASGLYHPELGALVAFLLPWLLALCLTLLTQETHFMQAALSEYNLTVVNAAINAVLGYCLGC